VSKVQTETKAKVDEVIAANGRPVTVLRFTGDISSTSRDTVLGTYEGVVKSRPVLIDFSKVEYINSSGIALVIQMLMEASKADQTIAAFGLTPHFQKVFTMVGITKYAALHWGEATAIASLEKETAGRSTTLRN
jgi:anti-sigma B factor antagonist